MSHLRLVPKPIVKCRTFPIPTRDGVEVWRDSTNGGWRLQHKRRGRLVELLLTKDELRDLVENASELLERDAGDD